MSDIIIFELIMGYFLNKLLCRSSKRDKIPDRPPKVEGRRSITRLNDEVKVISKNNILIRYDVDLMNEDIDELFRNVNLLKDEFETNKKTLKTAI